MKETLEIIQKRYKKSNKEARVKLLKKFGVNSIEKLENLFNKSAKEVFCNMTELSRILLNHPAVELKVSFQKQVKWEDAYNEVMYSWQNASPLDFPKNLKKTIKETLNGVERIAWISHNCKFDNFGRLYAQDLEQVQKEGQKSNSRMILISLNHLNWVEISGIRYILK